MKVLLFHVRQISDYDAQLHPGFIVQLCIQSFNVLKYRQIQQNLLLMQRLHFQSVSIPFTLYNINFHL